MDDHIPKLAELHFVAEQNARHARIWEDHDQAPPCPDFKDKWQTVTPKLREGYLERAHLLASSDLHEKARNDYERFVELLYARCFADVDPLAVKMTSCISVGEFRTQLDNLNDKNLSEIYQSLAIEDEEDESDFEDYMSDADDPLEYSLRDNEDPTIPIAQKVVEKGKIALQSLQKALEGSHVSTNDTDWKSEIDGILPYAQTAKVIIGVVGSTGVGKSSLINAIVDVENILATNCMRASTAVATEISYNHGNFKYKAQIEFISRDDWKRELEILVSDLMDNREELIKGKVPRDSEAAVAMDKIKAVYPWLEPKDILATPIETLLGHSSVVHLLGSSRDIEENNARVFSLTVRLYVDSRSRRAPEGKEPKDHQEMRLWPLIRVVRVFVKAEALSTGAVLVDLPGIFDSNSARVAVAEEYMKRCAAHWIVAPINRAVDDKVARDLLSTNFKLQMQMDSAFNDITFICTKTDDVSVREVRDSLKLNLPVQKQREANLVKMKNALRELRDRKSRNMEELAYLNDELDELEERLSAGEHAIDPSLLSPSKRRHSDIESNPVANLIEISPRSSTTDYSTSMNEGISVETQQLLGQYRGAKARRKTLQAQRRPLNEEIQQKEEELEEFEENSNNMQEEILRQCIKARNDYSKQEIKRDFARGILDLDEEYQAEEIETTGEEAEVQIARDYDALEKDLPVFCVSTRAYQKLRGRLRKEPVIEGFGNLEETEMPQLQKHCIGLTAKARKTSALRFLAKLDRLLQSMSLWSSVTSSANIAHYGKTRKMEDGFDKAFSMLSSKTENSHNVFTRDLGKIFKAGILKKLDRAIDSALKEFPQTVNKWNARRAEGGLAFQTYRATCKRQGVFRDKNWNDDLATPMLSTIMHGWKTCFEKLSPQRLQQLIGTLVTLLHEFHEDALLSADDSLSTESKEKLDKSVETYCGTLETSLNDLLMFIKTEQKEASRVFAQVIRRELNGTYRACAEQIGLGTLNRMRELMDQRAKDASEVFRKSADQVRQDLLKLYGATDEKLGEIIGKTVNDMRRDYYTVIIEPQVRKFSNEQIQIRRKAHRIIQATQAELQLDEILKMKPGSHRASSETIVKAEPIEWMETTGVQVGVAIKRELEDMGEYA